jgi:hypothetical protein
MCCFFRRIQINFDFYQALRLWFLWSKTCFLLKCKLFWCCCCDATWLSWHVPGRQCVEEVRLYAYTTCALEGEGWSAPRPRRFTHRKNTGYPPHRGLGGPRGPSGFFSEIYRPYRASNRDRPVRSESLYWLSYPGRRFYLGLGKMLEWFVLF